MSTQISDEQLQPIVPAELHEISPRHHSISARAQTEYSDCCKPHLQALADLRWLLDDVATLWQALRERDATIADLETAGRLHRSNEELLKSAVTQRDKTIAELRAKVEYLRNDNTALEAARDVAQADLAEFQESLNAAKSEATEYARENDRLRQQWLARSPAYDPSLVEDADRIEVELSRDEHYGAAQLIPRLLRALWDSQAEVAELREKVKGRRCAATISTDPPSDCDAPFCGCNPEWHVALDAARESGWLNSSEASKLQAELAELRKPVAVEVNPDVEHWRSCLRDCPWTLEPRHFAGLLGYYNTLASNNAAWQRASDAWQAEMRGLREQLDTAEQQDRMKTGEVNLLVKENRSLQERERQLRNSLSNLADAAADTLREHAETACCTVTANCIRFARAALAASPAPVESDRRCEHGIRWPHECDQCFESAPALAQPTADRRGGGAEAMTDPTLNQLKTDLL